MFMKPPVALVGTSQREGELLAGAPGQPPHAAKAWVDRAATPSPRATESRLLRRFDDPKRTTRMTFSVEWNGSFIIERGFRVFKGAVAPPLPPGTRRTGSRLEANDQPRQIGLVPQRERFVDQADVVVDRRW